MPVKKFVLNNEYYFLPVNAQAINRGDGAEIYINGRKTKEIDSFSVTEEQFFGERCYFNYLVPLYPFQSFLAEQYASIDVFLSKNPNMTYLQFDSKTCEDMVLFSFFPKFDFMRLDSLLESINRTMPYIMNIFIHPVIHLKSEEFIMPLYAVKRIDRNTVRHIMSHPEHWKSIDNGRIKPMRLLTEVYEDDYTIYENKVFCRTMDQMVALLRKYKNIFTDIIYNKISFQLSAMDKSNHMYYYLALGKLYVGYAKSDELFTEKCEKYVKGFDRIISRISANHTRPIYRKNLKSKIGRRIAKTNILAMHKDYRHIFTLKKTLDRADYPAELNELKTISDPLKKNYENFCIMLTIFSIGHFRFRTDESLIFENKEFKGVNFEFEKWHIELLPVKILSLNMGAVVMTVSSDIKKHVTLLIPFMSDPDNECPGFFNSILYDIAREYQADNYIFFTAEKALRVPTYYSNTPISYGILPVSINDVNSFKRIQRLLLDAMIKVSVTHDICPFCGGTFETNGKMFYCKKCKMELSTIMCENCGKSFYYTSVNYPAIKEKTVSRENYAADNYWKYCQDKDAQMNYRNITDLNSDGSPICPHCNAVNPKPKDIWP